MTAAAHDQHRLDPHKLVWTTRFSLNFFQIPQLISHREMSQFAHAIALCTANQARHYTFVSRTKLQTSVLTDVVDWTGLYDHFSYFFPN